MRKQLLSALAVLSIGMGGALASDTNDAPIFFRQDKEATATGHNAHAVRDAQENVAAYQRLIGEREQGRSFRSSMQKSHKAQLRDRKK